MNTKANNGKKEKWTMPLSQAYYRKLERRALAIMKRLGGYNSDAQVLMDEVDRYIRTGMDPQLRRCGQRDYLIIMTLIDDIEDAIKRSADCRRRAAERRARKEAEKAEAEAKAKLEAEAAAKREAEKADETAAQDCRTEKRGTDNKNPATAEGRSDVAGRELKADFRQVPKISAVLNVDDAFAQRVDPVGDFESKCLLE